MIEILKEFLCNSLISTPLKKLLLKFIRVLHCWRVQRFVEYDVCDLWFWFVILIYRRGSSLLHNFSQKSCFLPRGFFRKRAVWTHRESNTGFFVANEVFYHWTMGPSEFATTLFYFLNSERVRELNIKWNKNWDCKIVGRIRIIIWCEPNRSLLKDL